MKNTGRYQGSPRLPEAPEGLKGHVKSSYLHSFSGRFLNDVHQKQVREELLRPFKILSAKFLGFPL